MKLILFLIVAFSVQSYANALAQTISLNRTDAAMKDVFREIKTQTGYTIICDAAVLKKSGLVTVNLQNVPLENALKTIFDDRGLTYVVDGRSIVVHQAETKTAPMVFSATAAQREVAGRVVDGSGSTLAGISVSVKGKAIATATNESGQFTIQAQNGDVLIFSSVGYADKEVTVGSATVNVILESEDSSLDEVVVVGYGTQKKRSVTGSVASVNYDEFKDRSFSNVVQSLSGTVPGVNITQSQGAPGAAPVVQIRGISSITAGTNPLFVVDGVPLEDFNMNMINSQDIQSVEILKDASSASIYGSRGANGVIMITTKLGKPGKAIVSAGFDYGIQKVTRMVDMMDAQEWIRYYVAAKNNAWVDLNPEINKASDPNSARGGSTLYKIPEEFINSPEQFGQGTDWQDVMFRTAPMTNAQLSVSGGTDATQYLFSAGLLDQDAVLDQNYYRRLGLRSNIRQKLSDKVSVGMNLSLTGIHDRTEGVNGKSDVISLALQSDPFFPLYNENGNLGMVDPNSIWYRYPQQFNPVNLWHPYATTRFTNKKNKAYNTFALGFLEYDIIEGLKFRSSLSANLSNNTYNFYRMRNQGYGFNQDLASSAATADAGNKLNWLWENTVTYDFVMADHSFNVLAGYTSQKERTEFQSVTAANFPNDLVQTINAGTVTGGTSTASEWAIQSYLGRVNYNFMNRYFLSASIRRDGSSRFSKNNQWGYFPSVSAGWVISDESFMKGLTGLNLLKLKASYGQVGNNQIPNYGSISLLGAANYVSNGNIIAGLKPITLDNSALRWEKTSQLNVGLDVAVLQNRLSATVEVYRSITEDMLLNVPIPDITGFSSQLTNVGKMRNSGVEILVSSKNVQGNFTWSTDVNFSLNRNKVLQLGPGNAPIYYTDNETTVRTAVGSPVSDYFGYVFDGVYNNITEIENSPHEGTTRPGDPIIVDINGDGQITTDDRTVLGNNQANFIAGITNRFGYKGIELSFLLQGRSGGEIVNQNYRFLGFWNSGRNLFAGASNFWESEQNPGDGVNPRPSANRRPFQQGFSTLWVEDASFLRVKNITLSYNIPQSVLSKTPFDSFRVFLNADNVLLFSKYRGYDPENTTYKATNYSAGTSAANTGVATPSFPSGSMLGIDYGSYPLPLVVTLGFKTSF
ncbi:TonB-dependent receptor [Sphingobacterium gobiense]|nr:TonB-dependent receptor [Sphingobacterium gobiense]